MLSHSSCITLAAQGELAVARLALSLAYLFISPEISPVSPPSIVQRRTKRYHVTPSTSGLNP
jgi:hypothetical protein